MAAPRIKGGIGADAPFWDGLEEGRFLISRCGGCHEWLWPAHFRCGTCGSWDVRWEQVAPHGTIYTWTRNYLVSDVLKERRGDLPYVTLLVTLPGAGNVRLAGVLNSGESRLAIGARVSGTILPASERSRGYTTMVWTIDGQPAA